MLRRRPCGFRPRHTYAPALASAVLCCTPSSLVGGARSFSSLSGAPFSPLHSTWRRPAIHSLLTQGPPAWRAVAHQHRCQSTTAESDYYAVLGVRPEATQDEIKSAYKKLALQYHPDRNHEPGAEEKFKTVSAAYNVVGNKERRREYDAQRAMFGGASASANASNNGYPRASYGQYPQAGSGFQRQYQQMSQEEADRLFRDIFGGMRVDQIFRNLEEEMRRSGANAGSGLGASVGESFPDGSQTFRPFFQSPSKRVFVDQYGNRMEETVYSDPRGTRFTVHRTTSTNPNASMNQTEEDYSSAHRSSRDGRVHFGRSSVKYGTGQNDFTQQFLGFRSHGRSPVVAFLILGAWTVVLTTIVYCTFYFLFHHPFFTLAVLFLLIAARRGRF